MSRAGCVGASCPVAGPSAVGRAADQRPRRDARCASPPSPSRFVSAAAWSRPTGSTSGGATSSGKTPVWISLAEGELFAFAGIWAALPRARTAVRPAQLRDRHLRAERADPPDPRSDAGGARRRTPRRAGSTRVRRRSRWRRSAGAGAGGAACRPRGRRCGQRRSRGRAAPARPAARISRSSSSGVRRQRVRSGSYLGGGSVPRGPRPPALRRLRAAPPRRASPG